MDENLNFKLYHLVIILALVEKPQLYYACYKEMHLTQTIHPGNYYFILFYFVIIKCLISKYNNLKYL